ncbi:hypothetical protein [Pseudonocardia sp.]|uniref:hypothetical protein n=1 Tax=Pseudonocardia sp. TaxID=60912 RepID=UPI002621FCDF|nr:hypothetical protein [Pseudonocardia sp.]
MPAPARRLVEIRVGVDDPDDLDAAAASLHKLELPVSREGGALLTREPVAGFRAA